MPTLAEFALPASVTLRAAHDGTEKCHGRKTATCAGGDNCQAPKQAVMESARLAVDCPRTAVANAGRHTAARQRFDEMRARR